MKTVSVKQKTSISDFIIDKRSQHPFEVLTGDKIVLGDAFDVKNVKGFEKYDFVVVKWKDADDVDYTGLFFADAPLPIQNTTYKTLKKAVEAGLEKLNQIPEHTRDKEIKGAIIKAKKLIPKKQKTTKTTKPIKKSNIDIKFLDHYSNEYMLLRRFYNLINSKVPVTFKRIQSLYRAFEKSAVERKVRKTSKEADLFTQTNQKLVKLYKLAKPTESDLKIKITDKKYYERLENYVKGQKIDPAISLLRRFINLEGTKPETAKAKRLLTSITNALKNGKVAKNNRLYNELNQAKKELETYLQKPVTIKPEARGLNRPSVKQLFDNVKKRVPALKKKTIAGLKPISDEKKSNFQKFDFGNEPLGKFLGDVEIKEKGSVVVTLDAPQGAGKTRQLFQFANLTAGNNLKTLFISLEEAKNSSLFQNKVEEYLSDKAKQNFYVIDEIESLQALNRLIEQFDVIMVDSWNKLYREIKNKEGKGISLDYDFRKKFNGKLFFFIYQRTQNGLMRGGSEAQFDGDIVLKIEKLPDWHQNYVYYDKNRYMIDNYVWNVSEQKLYSFDEYMEILENNNKE